MRQSDMERLLRSGGAVPDGQIFGASTRSTAHVQLGRVKRKIERESGNTIERLQCYRLEQCTLPTGLEHSPVLSRLATTLLGSTALSKEQLMEQVWPYGGSDTDLWNGIHRLRDDWGLNVVSTGYHQVGIKT
jgi:biotin operon repressor